MLTSSNQVKPKLSKFTFKKSRLENYLPRTKTKRGLTEINRAN